jgi:hypothetical protein
MMKRSDTAVQLGLADITALRDRRMGLFHQEGDSLTHNSKLSGTRLAQSQWRKAKTAMA